MKKTVLYGLLFSGILFIAGAYIYHQYQYKKFEEFFMNAKLYGDNKIIPDTTFSKMNKELDLFSKDFKYEIFLKQNKNDNKSLGNIYFITSFDKNLKIIGGSSGGSLLNNNPFYGINNSIYLKFISEKWVPNKKSAFYLIVEYPKNKRIQYYFEIKEKIQNNKYTIYFKSYPPKKILDGKNEYIKD